MVIFCAFVVSLSFGGLSVKLYKYDLIHRRLPPTFQLLHLRHHLLQNLWHACGRLSMKDMFVVDLPSPGHDV